MKIQSNQPVTFTNFTFIFFLYIAISVGIYSHLNQPSNNRDWTMDQKIFPEISIGTTTVSIKNIKNFTYGKDEHEQFSSYFDATYPTEIKDVWYFQNDFKEPLGAHTFLSFEFPDGRFLSASVEIRKEKGESYDPWLGIFGHYEIFYMLVSEEDILTLRAKIRQEPVYMYKLRLSKEEKKALFLAWLSKAKQTQENPEFYNTLNNACTSNIFHRLNEVLQPEKKLTIGRDAIFPKTSDEYLYEHELIDSGLMYVEIKNSSKINQKVKEASLVSSSTISKFIRARYIENSSI